MYSYDYNRMMQEQMRLKAMRRNFSTLGWALLIYTIIMNVIVITVTIMDELSGTGRDNSGWGYLLTIAVGLVLLLLWKKPRFCFGTVWQRGKPMKLGSFLALLALCMSAQLVSQVVMIVMELFLNQFGLSVVEYLMSVQDGDTLGMFLYMAVGAPVSEEILFRGFALRSMEPYGKKFAIFASALLFGLFHGNLIQIPFALVVGLVLGYVAVEHSIAWAMVLHMFNNLVFADMLPRLMGAFVPQWENLLTWAMILGSAVASVVILIVKRKAVGVYLRRERTDPQCDNQFFSAPGIIALMIVVLLSMVLSLFAMAV